MKILNPYRPGAGQMPQYLAGRDDIINEMESVFDALKLNVPMQSVIFHGLRGVGKTVLINKLEEIAQEKDIFCRHIETEIENDFFMQIITCAQIYLRQHSKAENVKSIVNKLFDAIKSFVVTYDPDNSTFSLSFEEKNLYTMSDISQSLTEVIVAIGQLAQNVNTPICFFVDEMQYLKKKELGAFLTAIHRANQLGYPIMVVGAGLPRLVKLLSDVRSYSERLFIYKEIDSLSKDQARLAIINPALSINKTYSEEAINEIFEITKGYPFFIQQFCQTMFNGELDEIISLKNVDSATKEYYQTLDAGFFHSRYERCSEGEKRFIFAMVDCGSLPCTISNVAINMNKEVKAISPTRAQLIDKGIIYSVKHSELDFTVPDFDEYLKRIRKTI